MAKKKHKRRKERGIHNRAVISSSDNWPCNMKELSIQINTVSLELYYRELHLKELTSQGPYSVSLTHTVYAGLLLHFRPHSLLYISNSASASVRLFLGFSSVSLIFSWPVFDTHSLLLLNLPPPSSRLKERGFVW